MNILKIIIYIILTLILLFLLTFMYCSLVVASKCDEEEEINDKINMKESGNID